MHMTETGKKEGELLVTTALSTAGYKKKIIDILKKNRAGLTIADIAREVGTTRHTASIILAELRGAKLIDIRKIGIAKLHNWRYDQ
jgi:CRP-like cAMP-binding protein